MGGYLCAHQSLCEARNARPKDRHRAATVGFVLACLWLFLTPQPATAHALVKKTTPTIDQVVDRSPALVTMSFSEPVEVAFGSIRVYNTDGERVDRGKTRHIEGQADEIEVGLERALARGTYTVAWRVVSADGHPISEAFVFHVGRPGPNPEGIAESVLGDGQTSVVVSVLFGVTRWVNFAGLLTLVGARSFSSECGYPRTPWGIALQGSRNASQSVGAWWRWHRGLRFAAATCAGVVFQGAVAAGVPLADAFSSEVMSDVFGTRYGTVALVKAGLLMVAAVLWVSTLRSEVYHLQARSVGAARATPSFPTWVVMAGGVIALLLLATPGLAGHAGTTPPAWANIAADSLHLVGAAAWAGGLVILLTAGFASVKSMDNQESARALGPVVVRFSNMAMIAVALLVGTGTFRGWVEVGTLGALTDATYGWVLLTKLAVFVPLIVLGMVNNRWTKPRIEKAMKGTDLASSPLGVLRRLVALEVVLVAVVLAVTALLVNLAQAHVEARVSGPYIADVELARYDLNVLVDPNEVGANEIHLTVTEASGTPAAH